MILLIIINKNKVVMTVWKYCLGLIRWLCRRVSTNVLAPGQH